MSGLSATCGSCQGWGFMDGDMAPNASEWMAMTNTFNFFCLEIDDGDL